MFIGCTLLFLLIIIIVVVYDYYYLSSLLAEDWHFEICLSLDAVAEKNKLLLLILFHKSLEILYPCLLSLLLLTLVFVRPSLTWTLVLFISTCYFWWLDPGQLAWKVFSTWGFDGEP